MVYVGLWFLRAKSPPSCQGSMAADTGSQELTSLTTVKKQEEETGCRQGFLLEKPHPSVRGSPFLQQGYNT